MNSRRSDNPVLEIAVVGTLACLMIFGTLATVIQIGNEMIAIESNS